MEFSYLDDATAEEMAEAFRGKILSELLTRFCHESTPSLGIAGAKSRIVTVNVCEDANYILATLLDPRVGLFAFKGMCFSYLGFFNS